MSSQNQKPTKKPRDPDLVGAEIALRRAAERVRRRAAETGSTVVVVKDGKVVWEKVDGTSSDEEETRMGNKNSRSITNVKQYLEWIEETVEPIGRYAFRGQEDATWSLECGAALRLRESYDSQSEEEGQHRFVQYHRLLLIRQARHEGFDQDQGKELGDFEVLAKLQHLGAATCLLDFTRSSLVALWFACQPRTAKRKETDGKVFSVNTNDRAKFRELTQQDAQGKDNLGEFFLPHEAPPRNIMSWYWEPPMVSDVAPRMLRQHSLFIFGHMVLPEETTQSVVIPAANKTDILEELCSQHDITRETLFKDIYGFADANNRKSPLTGIDTSEDYIRSGTIDTSEDYIRSGTIEFNKENFEAAIQSFDQAIYLEPERAQLYFSRAYAKAALGKYEEAIKDYDISISKLPQVLRPEDMLIEPVVLFNRGNARVQLRDFDAAIDDYWKCIEERSGDLENIIRRVDIEIVYFNLANVFSKIQRWDEAISAYKKAILLKNDFRDAHYNLGNAEVQRGEHQQALLHYGDAIACSNETTVDESYIHAWQNRAATRALLNDLETAMEEFLENGAPASNIQLVEKAIAGEAVENYLVFLAFNGNIGNVGARPLFDLSPGKGSTGDAGFPVQFHWSRG